MKFAIITRNIHLHWITKLHPICHREFSKVTANTFLHCLRKEDLTPRIALVDHSGNHTYDQLHKNSNKLSETINNLLSGDPQQRVAVLVPNNVSYVISLLATWKSGHMCVPLSHLYPKPQLEYFLKDSQATLLVSTEEHEDMARSLSQSTGVPTFILNANNTSETPLDVHPNSNGFFNDVFLNKSKALIVYTSGTTGPPKGVVVSHVNLEHQVKALINGWSITKSDIILHTLPLHHVHGIVAALLSILAVGGTCVMLPKFDAQQVWKRLMDTTQGPGRVNMFMAVPTIYAKLIEEFEKSYAESPRTRDYIRAVCVEKIRLMTCGSASLPDTILNRFKEISGHGLLERYGMSEIGFALSNPLDGERKAGSVGTPMHGFEVRIAKANVYTSLGYDIICHSTSSQTTVTPGTQGEPGELHIKGPAVFGEYWNRPQETKSAFTQDGWFKTGDTFRFEDGAYRIVGRTSVDVIKSGGYKVSALDVERVILSHDLVSECAVVGLPDMTWGQRIAAVVVLRSSKDQLPSKVDGNIIDNLRQFCKNKLPTYSVPTIIRITDTIHKNAMGKVNKKDLIKRMFEN